MSFYTPLSPPPISSPSHWWCDCNKWRAFKVLRGSLQKHVYKDFDCDFLVILDIYIFEGWKLSHNDGRDYLNRGKQFRFVKDSAQRCAFSCWKCELIKSKYSWATRRRKLCLPSVDGCIIKSSSAEKCLFGGNKQSFMSLPGIKSSLPKYTERSSMECVCCYPKFFLTCCKLSLFFSSLVDCFSFLSTS